LPITSTVSGSALAGSTVRAAVTVMSLEATASRSFAPDASAASAGVTIAMAADADRIIFRDGFIIRCLMQEMPGRIVSYP
jgi:hypothetical protein